MPGRDARPGNFAVRDVAEGQQRRVRGSRERRARRGVNFNTPGSFFPPIEPASTGCSRARMRFASGTSSVHGGARWLNKEIERFRNIAREKK